MGKATIILGAVQIRQANKFESILAKSGKEILKNLKESHRCMMSPVFPIRHVEVVLANKGIATFVPIETVSRKKINSLFNLNVRGLFLTV